MLLSSALLFTAATLVASDTSAATYTRSSKRGLVYIPNLKHVSDNQIWVDNDSDLTWYYNYAATDSATYSALAQDKFEFVPMLWTTDTTFLSTVKGLISGGRNITHVLTYNEPDGTAEYGGSAIDAATAAKNWISQVQPLAELGIKLGAPAVVGGTASMTWLTTFFDTCASLGTNCTVDFFPLHVYGDFQALASRIGEFRAAYPDTNLWVTEFADNNQTMADTESYFNSSISYLDRLDYVERYSYFGAFRSDVSNVGPNAAFLTQKGDLTTIGSWYLGGAATDNVPSNSGAGDRISGSSSWIAAVVGLIGLMILS